jgi:hypothetical protein
MTSQMARIVNHTPPRKHRNTNKSEKRMSKCMKKKSKGLSLGMGTTLQSHFLRQGASEVGVITQLDS